MQTSNIQNIVLTVELELRLAPEPNEIAPAMAPEPTEITPTIISKPAKGR